MRWPGPLPIRLGSLLLIVALSACEGPIEHVPPPFLPTSAHQAYAHGLEQAHLADTALGVDWLGAAERAISGPVAVSPPFQETVYFDAARADAVGYRFAVTGGQRVEAQVDVEADSRPRIFLDLFRLPEEPAEGPVHVATGPAFDPRLEFEPRRDAVYILRVQPELLRSGRFTVVVRSVPQLEFPVEGLDTGAIQSSFGAPRDAGRRQHHGVDIFAPRGTPVVAAADGIVRRAQTTEVGGNVVWLRHAVHGYSLYYAHLDSYTVARGQRVSIGDVIGYVGNTGNARTTPTHLHFGVYSRGPTDPYPFIYRGRVDPVPIRADVANLGVWTRATSNGLELLTAPESRADVADSIDRDTPMRVWAASASWYRVGLPGGRHGYVAAHAVEALSEPLRLEALSAPRVVLTRPGADAPVLEELVAGARIPVFGSYGSFLYVRTPMGRAGWISLEE